MAKLVWDADTERTFETGDKKCVLYPRKSDGTYEKGAAWNGLTAVTESPSGADANDMYADDVKYGSLRSSETFGGTIEAYTYPEEFEQCDGSYSPAKGVSVGQQKRKPFGLSYVTTKGNDTDGLDYGYKIHLVWNATASPSEKSYSTVNDSPEAITFSWEFSTTPTVLTALDADGKQLKPTSHLEIDSTKCDAASLKKLEDMLYGTDSTEAKLPTPDEVIAMFSTTSTSSSSSTGSEVSG